MTAVGVQYGYRLTRKAGYDTTGVFTEIHNEFCLQLGSGWILSGGRLLYSFDWHIFTEPNESKVKILSKTEEFRRYIIIHPSWKIQFFYKLYIGLWFKNAEYRDM